VPDLIDRVAGLGLQFPSRNQVIFPDGWGDRSAFDLLTQVERAVEPVRPAWRTTTDEAGLRRHAGRFSSPLRDVDAVGDVPVELIEPSGGTDRLVVLFPAWNQEGFAPRHALAEALARQGVAVALLEIPLYGKRRRPGAAGMPIRTVSDFFVMGVGAIVEALALLTGLESQYPSLGVAGFSMGGNLAALTSAISARPLATALMAAPHTPRAPYLEGNLSHAIRWEALGGRTARPELTARLGAISALAYPARAHHRRAILVGGTGDGFVPPDAVEELAAHWQAEVRWLRGGHGILWWRHRLELVRAVLDSFAAVNADRGSGPG
jgi:dienelactone hydrolase